MDGEGGMAWNMPDRNIQKPCTECIVTFMLPGLEDPAGHDVNSDVGLWLHHMVLINKGKGLKDATCAKNPMSLPHMDVWATSLNSERFFASGNERTPLDTKLTGVKAGYLIKSDDTMSAIIELMNMNADHKDVYMTMVWEYIPKIPSDFKNAKPVWLDVFQCGLSDVKPKSEEGKFKYEYSWTSNVNGEILGVDTHLHDGGLNVDIRRNGRSICNSISKYGESEKYRSKAMEMESGGKGSKMMTMPTNTEHISSQSACYYESHNLGHLKKGDKLAMTGFYDYKEHAGMPKNNGKQSDVMVIAIMYVAVPMGRGSD
jgi:hypothetical protein